LLYSFEWLAFLKDLVSKGAFDRVRYGFLKTFKLTLEKKIYHLIQLSINIPALTLALAYPAVTQNIERLEEQAYFKKRKIQ
jgi:hypothetical protein